MSHPLSDDMLQDWTLKDWHHDEYGRLTVQGRQRTYHFLPVSRNVTELNCWLTVPDGLMSAHMQYMFGAMESAMATAEHSNSGRIPEAKLLPKPPIVPVGGFAEIVGRDAFLDTHWDELVLRHAGSADLSDPNAVLVDVEPIAVIKTLAAIRPDDQEAMLTDIDRLDVFTWISETEEPRFVRVGREPFRSPWYRLLFRVWRGDGIPMLAAFDFECGDTCLAYAWHDHRRQQWAARYLLSHAHASCAVWPGMPAKVAR
ncbi:hypothetical protein AL072_33000 [Azospirillum thiophilum]|uniref:Uncharacterized protein n=1 Tax=Azospirillum thiophilum TaxID=528244 RepID=A0AAC8W600_9PROT|nr:hypothetical protein [Azospirillum thiophilum]ALG75752.1 hypothetical protein AL072_33000 [Azospirillum thiophilum]